jgi:tetratricopeptide (TPR) repeat protein
MCDARLSRLIAALLAAYLLAGPAIASERKDNLFDYVQAGENIAAAFNEGQVDTVIRMLDMEALSRRVAATVVEGEKDRADFALGFQRGSKVEDIGKLMFGQRDGSDLTVKFVRVVQCEYERCALLRFDYGDNGFDYIEFAIRQDNVGRTRIVDWAPLTTGEMVSVTIGSTARLVLDTSPNLLARLLGLKSVDQAAVKRMKDIGQMRRNGDFKGAYVEIGKLPPELANTRAMLTLQAAMANEAGDTDGYKRTLVRLNELHGNDPAAATMLLDHYFYNKDLDNSLRVISIIEARVGADGLTNLLRANVYAAVGRNKEAIASAREAIRLEPDYTAAYFTLAQELVRRGKFAQAIDAYKTLQSEFGYEFSRDNFAEDDQYRKFIASTQFRKWMVKKR